jgi:hypothetical protein
VGGLQFLQGAPVEDSHLLGGLDVAPLLGDLDTPVEDGDGLDRSTGGLKEAARCSIARSRSPCLRYSLPRL